MSRSPRAVALWVAAALVALVTARVVATDLAALHRRAAEQGAPRAVLVAARDLPLGATVRRGDLATAQLAGSGVPDHVLDAPADAVGRTVRVPVPEGGLVLPAHLAPARRDGLDGVVPRGMRAVRVAPEDGLRPEPGDVVDVLVTLDPSLVVEAGGGEPTLTVAAAARVLAVDGGNGDGADGYAPAGGVGVTLLVSDDDAHRLAFAAANGVLTLALAPPEDACCNPSSSGSSRD